MSKQQQPSLLVPSKLG
jgi:hypothetical protein